MIQSNQKPKLALAIHGGAGAIERSLMTPEKEALFKIALKRALDEGVALLKSGKPALDAVQIAVQALEDCELFNAGRGSVFASDKTIQLDASIMRGSDIAAGAVCAVSNIKNPISLARKVLEHSQHVLLTGTGAEEFAKHHGEVFEDDEYFYTQHRMDQLLKVIDTEKVLLDHNEPKPIGTVGAVACDSSGNLAAATSTGGMTNKKYGRIGDSPIIGAGTYANNKTCAISCTGHGEFFIRNSVAFQVHSRMELLNESLEQASNHVIHNVLTPIQGEGGLIAIDKDGNISMPFNSQGMYRGKWREDLGYIASIYL